MSRPTLIDDPRRAAERVERADGRPVPYNIEAEASLIGAMLLSASAIEAGRSGCASEDFFSPVHANIFDAIVDLYDQGDGVDPLTVAEALAGAGLGEGASQADLAHLQARTPATSSAARYARIVAEAAAMRRALLAAHAAAEAAREGDAEALAAATDSLQLATTAGLASRARPFLRIDLAAMMREGVEEPAMLTDWLYAGCLTTLQGEPACGKSWLAAWQALEVMDAGYSVVYLDEEGGPELTVERLTLLGADPALVAERLHYFAFESRKWDQVDLVALEAVIAQAAGVGHGVGLGVLDSLPDFLAAAALSENDAPEVTAFFAAVCGRFRRAGAAQVVLDHLVKPSTGEPGKGKGRYARGSGAKLAKADATILVETAAEFNATTSGSLRVHRTKDRRGRLGLPGLGQPGLVLAVDVAPGSLRIRPLAPEETTDWAGPTACMGAILDLLASTPDMEYSGRSLGDALRANGQAFRDRTVRESAQRLALDQQVDVRAGARGSHYYRHRPHPLDEEF